MKVLAVLTLVAAAIAVPEAETWKGCKPATYRCNWKADGWEVCDVSGNWVWGGACAPNDVCKFYKPSGSPYCVPPSFNLPNGR
ncbi:hypothetical protein B0H67DRAFT_638574 [Lasiosphaeris hirsuta]|uniref:Uncharacterized protein n=1 Tax=Lasiosphaeris hirsuta TaxID=260670 RepID=A0AA40B9A1_9PEZI|nr:hypothetical protein B0H67DRAFT_638574 [Lasiosphaeris hirsuta]